MDSDKAIELIDATDIVFKDNPQAFLKGLQILAKYDDDIDPSFAHDQIWCCDFSETVEQMSEDEIKTMAECGWFEDEDAWSHF